MKKQTKHTIAAVVGPVVLGALKLHTRITGRERARLVVLDERGRVLLVKGFVGRGWSLPGGGIEKGETPMRAAIRELYEETGIQVQGSDLVEITVLQKPEVPINYKAHIFLARVRASDLPKIMHNTHELIELGWFDTASLPEGTSELVRVSLGRLS